MIRSLRFAIAAAAVLLSAVAARANTLFVDLPSPSGAFEWNVFQGSANGPHAPDVRSEGVGTSNLTVINNMLGGTLITGGNDIYTGFADGTIAKLTFALNGAANAGPSTAVVLQLALSPGGNDLTPGSILMGGATAPTTLVDRGVEPGGSHYYWALWQTAALPNYTVEFSGGSSVVLRGAQVDYVNSQSAISVVAPGLVPEPASASLAAMVATVAGFAMRRRKAC